MKITAPLYPSENSIDLTRQEYNKVALIDADRFKYVVAHNMFYEINTEGDTHSKELLERLIDSCLERYVFDHYKAVAYVFCFSAPSKQIYRHLLTSEKGYKANRRKSYDQYDYEQKFEDMAYVYRYIAERQISVLKNNLEADDVISLMQNEHTFVHSIDKDMRQVVGFHYDEEKRKLVEVKENEAFALMMKQTIIGDSTDNIPGLKGFGPKALEKIEKFEGEQLVQQVLAQFISKHGLINGFDMFVEMYNLVNLKKRRGEYCHEIYKDIIDLINALTKNLES